MVLFVPSMVHPPCSNTLVGSDLLMDPAPGRSEMIPIDTCCLGDMFVTHHVTLKDTLLL